MDASVSSAENQPCPIQFYCFSQLDLKKHCQVYAKIVQHKAEPEDIPVDSIEALGSELLALQQNVQNRMNLLESELLVLDSWQVKREYTRKPSFTQPPARKIQKLDSGEKPKKTKHSKQLGVGQESKTGKEPGQQDAAMLKLRGDAPDRFWSSVEPYTSDITESDICMLQEGISSYENSEELFRVPRLGQHYSRRWALEDLQEEQGESQRLGSMADPLALWDKASESQEDSYDGLLKDAESLQECEAKSQYGPLTERLVAAFLEDPVSGSKGSGSIRSHRPRTSLPVSSAHLESFEARLKKELINLGLLESQETEITGKEVDVDEILEELERKQADISSIIEYNRKQREVLVSLAKEEIKRQEVQASIREVEEEIMDWLKKGNIHKQKKKSLGRKERESIWKILESRENLLHSLELPLQQ